MRKARPRLLGKPTPLPASPDKAVLDRVPNPHPDTDYIARFTAPEFTTLCPITGQPDFAYLMIDYAPRQWLIESKSLKLYLASFRNHGAFHEDCTVAIGKKLTSLLKPKFLRIGGYWYPRGGMPIDVFWQTGKIAGRRVAAGPGRRALPRPRLGGRAPQIVAANQSRSSKHDGAGQQHRIDPDRCEAEAVNRRAGRVSKKEKE